MGRGSSSSGGSRGGSSSGGRGMSRSSFNSGRSGSHWGGHSHTTVIIGGGHHGHHGNYSTNAGFGTFVFMAVIFMAFGIGFSIFGINIAVESNKYGSVEAVCVDNDLIQGWYYTTYDYTVDGKDYTSMSEEGWEEKETVGKVVTIYYLKSDPNVITENEPNGSVGAGITIALFSLVFVGAGVLLIVSAVKTKKGANQTSEQTTSSPEIVEEKSKKCPYCGSRYNKDSDSCPKCGASRID